MPVAAKLAANSVPYSVDKHIGEQALETLDQWLFSSSAINKTEQQRLQNRFKHLIITSKKQYPYQLLFRSSKQMGANALTLPGGIIMTDGLFKLAENDEQIIAVLAHEAGHIEHRHSLRSLFQNSIKALFMAGVLGDITSITSLSVALPTILVESRYSRQFEQEADQYAIDFLKKHNIDVRQFIRILTLLKPSKSADDEFDYLSSHPAMYKRIEAIKALQDR